MDLLPLRIHPEEELTVLSSFVLKVLVEGVQHALLFWTAFTEDGEDPGFARCVLHRGNGVCGIRIKHCSATTNLRAHLMAHHNGWFILETEKKCDMQDKLVANGTGAIELQTTPKWTAQKIHLSNRKLSYWLCCRKRAPHLVFRFLSQGQRDTAVEAFRAQWTQKWQPQFADLFEPAVVLTWQNLIRQSQTLIFASSGALLPVHLLFSCASQGQPVHLLHAPR